MTSYGELLPFLVSTKNRAVRYLSNNFLPQEDSLPAWREKTFFSIFLCSCILGLIPYYSSIMWGLHNDKLEAAIIYTCIYIWMIIVLFSRRLPFSFRVWNGIAIYFTFGIISLYQLGPMGSGRIWLFASAVLASLLLGVMQSVIVLLLISGSSVAIWLLLSNGSVKWNILDNYSASTWLNTSVTQFFLCGIITISLAVLVTSLGKILKKEQLITSDLKELTNKLEREVRDRTLAQEELQGHKEHLESLVFIRTKKLSDTNQELLQEIENRKQAVSALLHLASGVAHNFNNVLMATSSNAQGAQSLLEHYRIADETIDLHLENVVKSAEVGRDVAKRLSRVVTGRQAIMSKPQPVDVADMIQKVERMVIGTWSQFVLGSLELRIEVQPDIYVLGIENEIIEVIFNLIKNSVEALQGRGVISVGAQKVNSQIHINVADNGPGLKPEVCARLFEPFVTTKGKAGLGLGLASSRDIILALDGDITFEEHAAVGASFTVVLPACDAPSAQACKETLPETSPLDILLVEDEALVAMGLQTILKGAGHKVRWASCLKRAKETLSEHVPDVVLCDLNLPDGPGWELARDVLGGPARGKGQDIAFIVLTGFNVDTIEDLPEGTPQPFAVLNKPVDSRVLLNIIARAKAHPGALAHIAATNL
jgi:signal transduction histidine kinase/CheY-like chemotaxis protein